MSYQQIIGGQAEPEVPINENMESLGQSFVWSHHISADVGLGVGISGGTFNATAIDDAVMACTDNATNYLVVHRGTLAITTSTVTTNWNNTAGYGRIARAIFASGVLAFKDERHSPGGIFDHSTTGALADGDYGDIVVSGAGSVINIDSGVLSTFGRTIANAANSSAARTALGLGTSAVLDVDTDGTMAANSASRVPAQSAVVSFVASQLDGRSWKQRVRAASTANGVLATAFANGQTMDGVTLVTGDRILLKDQTSASENGIRIVAIAGSPPRASDADTSAELVNATVEVSEGTTNADLQYTCSTNAPITVDTTALVWVLTSTSATYTADETTLHLSGSQFSIKSGGVGTTELASQAATYAKIQNVSATSRLLGRKTAGAGSAEELTLSDVLDLVGSAAQGDILYRGASTWTRLAAGTSGQMLKTQGASANPHWVDHEFLPVVSLSALTTASQILAKFTAPFAMTLAANMSGSKSTAADVAATASTVITISKNGSAIATATYAVSGTVPTLATTGGTSQSIAVDDVISITGPVTPDVTLSGIYLVALFARS